MPSYSKSIIMIFKSPGRPGNENASPCTGASRRDQPAQENPTAGTIPNPVTYDRKRRLGKSLEEGPVQEGCVLSPTFSTPSNASDAE